MLEYFLNLILDFNIWIKFIKMKDNSSFGTNS